MGIKDCVVSSLSIIQIFVYIVVDELPCTQLAVLKRPHNRLPPCLISHILTFDYHSY
jgi:hypothetical protein